MWFIKNVRHLLEKFIQRDSRFIVTFLGDLIKSLKIFNLEDILIDKEFEKILWFLYKLDMAILQINLLKYFLLNDPVFLNFSKNLPLSSFFQKCGKFLWQYLSVHEDLEVFFSKLMIKDIGWQVSFSSYFHTVGLLQDYELILNKNLRLRIKVFKPVNKASDLYFVNSFVTISLCEKICFYTISLSLSTN